MPATSATNSASNFGMAAAIGFLSVRQHHEHGYFGGYLIVNQLARPLEFHCTMPVKPSRAQQLLYGPTMDDFVCCEQIAKALISKAKLQPELVLTDTPAVLSVGLVCDAIVVSFQESVIQTTSGLRNPAQTQLHTQQFEVSGHRLLRSAEQSQAEQITAQVLGKLSERFELSEPFSRIVEALFEAHPVIKAAA